MQMILEFKRISVFAAVAGTLACLSVPARAAVSIVVQSRSVAPGTAGFLDVYVSGTDAGQVAASEVAVDVVTSPAGFAFTGDAVPTTTDPDPRPMLLGVDGFTSPDGVELNSAIRVSAAQVPAVTGDLSMADGRGLMRVPFSVAANAVVGTAYGISLDTTITNLFLNDMDFTPVAYTAVNGTISVIPEPTRVLTISLVASVLLKRGRCRSARNVVASD